MSVAVALGWITCSYAQDGPKPEVTIAIKNGSENKIYVFAGPKEEIRNPRISTYGGLSTNKVYVKEGDVICIMSEDNKPKSCAVVKPGMSAIEVNTSATTVTPK